MHVGFFNAWKSIEQQTVDLLNGGLAQNPDYRVVVVGHSLGGALVGLAYPGLKGAGFEIDKAFSFGQPRTGNPAYANYIDGLCGASDTDIGEYYRVTHANGE